MQIDQATLRRLYRSGLRKIRRSDVVTVLRRSGALRRLVNGPLASMGEEVSELLNMVRDYATGMYRELPRSTLLAAVFTLLYILNPFDMMPDFLPGIGFIDDMSMTALVIGSVRRDVDAYSRWRRSRRAIARRLRQTFGIRYMPT